jgi:hypothetical protein
MSGKAWDMNNFLKRRDATEYMNSREIEDVPRQAEGSNPALVLTRKIIGFVSSQPSDCVTNPICDAAHRTAQSPDGASLFQAAFYFGATGGSSSWQGSSGL